MWKFHNGTHSVTSNPSQKSSFLTTSSVSIVGCFKNKISDFLVFYSADFKTKYVNHVEKSASNILWVDYAWTDTAFCKS